MKIGVLGTGMVGTTLGTKLVELGHEVMLGARTEQNEKASAWAAKLGAKHGTFRQAAEHGEVLFNATLGSAALEVLEQAGAEHLAPIRQ